jgi:hypothetical protein
VLLLTVLLVVAAGVTIRVSALAHDVTRLAAETDRDDTLQAALDGAIQALADDPTPDVDSRFDPAFEYQLGTDGVSISIEDIGSRVNPNWIQIEFLERSTIRTIMEAGFTPEDLRVARLDAWYWRRDDPRLVDAFTEEARETLLTRYGYVNLNVCGELAMEHLYAEITGDDGAAAMFRSRIQDALRLQRMIREQELQQILSPYFDELYPLLNVYPAWNVNFVDSALIEAVLSYPAYGVEMPDAKTSAVLDRRDSGEMSSDDLRAIVGAGEYGRVFEFLGAVTWFWQITAQDDREYRSAIVARIPGLERSDDTYRVISVTGGRVE